MKSILLTLVFTLLTTNAFATVPFCSRNVSLVKWVEEYLNKSCAEITAAELAAIKDLNTSFHSIVPEDLEGFNSMEEFYSSYGSTHDGWHEPDIKPNLYRFLPNLKKVYIGVEDRHSDISALYKEIFDGVAPLEDLKIRHVLPLRADLFENPNVNRISSLSLYNGTGWYDQDLSFDNKFLKQFPNLKSFTNLGDAPSIPQDLFEGLIQLEHVGLIFQRFETLPVGLFQDLKNLKTINLEFCQKLTNLPDGIFANLPNLKTVYLNTTGIDKSKEAKQKLAAQYPNINFDYTSKK